MDIVYTGQDGEHLMHVPARDLSAEEYAALPAELQEAVQAAPFYEVREPSPPKAPKSVRQVAVTPAAVGLADVSTEKS